VVQYAMEASRSAGHSLMSPSTPRPYGQPGGVNAFAELIQACTATTDVLAEVLRNFWGLSVRVAFLGVSEKPQYYWRLDDFHVSQLSLESSAAKGQAAPEKSAMATLRLSDSACDVLLDRVLGGLATPFSFKQLSPLEGTILNEFSRDVLACLKKELLRKHARVSDSSLLHIIWVVQPEPPAAREAGSGSITPVVLADIPVGKIVFSVPPGALKHWTGSYHPPQAEEVVPDPFFYHVQTPQPVYLGSTRVQLADLEQLEPEDLILLENSHFETMALTDPASGQRVPFPVTIHHQQRITIPYTQEFATMETQSHSAKQSLWDNLMIEVDASFEPIKLPLKQLKQMTEGLVIEMGDLVHNRIALQVEGKTLAWGELLIVGDKFAVRVSQVAANPGEESGHAPPALMGGQSHYAQPASSMEEESEEASENDAEEENLDSFLDNDFDEIADDEEDW
jgi:flagellar motor switch/type III secretory pathway protein FliN